jgi:hypothetical protein
MLEIISLVQTSLAGSVPTHSDQDLLWPIVHLCHAVAHGQVRLVAEQKFVGLLNPTTPQATTPVH